MNNILLALPLMFCVGCGATVKSPDYWRGYAAATIAEMPGADIFAPPATKPTPKPTTTTETPQLKLTIYTSQSCPPCRRLENFLKTQDMRNWVVQFLQGYDVPTPTSALSLGGEILRKKVGFSGGADYMNWLKGPIENQAPAPKEDARGRNPEPIAPKPAPTLAPTIQPTTTSEARGFFRGRRNR